MILLKILVFYKVAMASTKNSYNTFIRIVRDSTAIGIGDATDSRPRVTSYVDTANTDYFICHHSNMFLDSPTTRFKLASPSITVSYLAAQ